MKEKWVTIQFENGRSRRTTESKLPQFYEMIEQMKDIARRPGSQTTPEMVDNWYAHRIVRDED